jgi:hypothetical protein
MLIGSELIARSALTREDSRGAHFREDFPETDNKGWLKNIYMIRNGDDGPKIWTEPVKLSHKEGLALNNGTAQMLATGVLAVAQLEELLDTADLAAAMTIDAFAGRLGAFDGRVHALRPHPGQVATASNLRQLLQESTLADIDYHLVPRFRT